MIYPNTAPGKNSEHYVTEDRFGVLASAAPGAIMAINQLGIIVMVNKQAGTLFGYTNQELVGAAVETLMPERFRTSHRAYRDNYLGDASSHRMGAGRYLAGRRKDGSEFTIEIRLSHIMTHIDHLTLAFITEGKRTAVALHNNGKQ
jgi:PAS domain S-box-containing protein